jgi:hypothetical protein
MRQFLYASGHGCIEELSLRMMNWGFCLKAASSKLSGTRGIEKLWRFYAVALKLHFSIKPSHLFNPVIVRLYISEEA